MAAASLAAIGGTGQGMNSGSRMYCPKASESTAIPAGLRREVLLSQRIFIHTYSYTEVYENHLFVFVMLVTSYINILRTKY